MFDPDVRNVCSRINVFRFSYLYFIRKGYRFSSSTWDLVICSYLLIMKVKDCIGYRNLNVYLCVFCRIWFCSLPCLYCSVIFIWIYLFLKISWINSRFKKKWTFFFFEGVFSNQDTPSKNTLKIFSKDNNYIKKIIFKRSRTRCRN